MSVTAPPRKLLLISLLGVLGALLPGCTPNSPPDNGGSSDDDPVPVWLQMNLDPDDPEMAIVTGQAKGDKLVLFGAKNEAGDPLQVESVQYYASEYDAAPQSSLLLDELGRPLVLVDSHNAQATFVYDDANDAVVVFYRGADGSEEIVGFALPEGANVAKGFRSPDTFGQPAWRSRADEETPRTTEVIRITVGIFLVSEEPPNEVLYPVPDGIVEAVSTTADHIPPAALFGNTYELAVTSHPADVSYLVEQCEARAATLDNVMMAATLILSAALIACTGASSGVCGFLAANAAAFTGIGIGLSAEPAPLLRTASVTCRDRVIQSALADGTGEVAVTVHARVPRLDWSAQKTVTYNLLDPDDPVTSTKAVHVDFEISADGCAEGCPDDRYCEEGACVECIVTDHCGGLFCTFDHTCVECVVHTNCLTSAFGPYCDEGGCGGCLSDEWCSAAGLGRRCDTLTGRCVECVTDGDCVAAGLGQRCLERRCVECLDPLDCGAQKTCDVAEHACVPATDDGNGDADGDGDVEPSGSFTIIGYQNTNCAFPGDPAAPPGACGTGSQVDPAMAQIQLRGDAGSPVISWSGLNGAFSLIVTASGIPRYALTGETPPDADGNTEQVAFAFSSIAYGTYGLPNTVPVDGVSPGDAAPLSAGPVHSVMISTLSGETALLTFLVN